tara:strand:- start:87 stop:212 length:126 start_codon:yes stop_codon:yes gene_type:complete
MENNNYAYIKYVMGAKNANAFKIKLNDKARNSFNDNKSSNK